MQTVLSYSQYIGSFAVKHITEDERNEFCSQLLVLFTIDAKFKLCELFGLNFMNFN